MFINQGQRYNLFQYYETKLAIIFVKNHKYFIITLKYC